MQSFAQPYLTSSINKTILLKIHQALFGKIVSQKKYLKLNKAKSQPTLLDNSLNFIEWIILLGYFCQSVISTRISHLTHINLKNNQILKVQIIKCLYLCKWLKPLKLESLINQDQVIRLIKSHNFKVNIILLRKSNLILVHSEEQEEEEEEEEE